MATAVLAGNIKSFHALKWRVAMALSADRDFSVPLMDIFVAVNRLFSDRDRLAQLLGSQRESIDTIDAYDGVDTRYNFPTLSALADACAPNFELVDVQRGQYELAECCPTVCFKPRVVDQPGIVEVRNKLGFPQ